MMSRRNEVMTAFSEQKEWMNRRVAEGIAKYRQGPLCVTVTDQNGTVQNAQVEIEQTAHAFNFGANLFMLDEFNTEKENAAYRTHFAELFNAATLPFYWSDLEPQEGKVRFTKDSPKIYRRPVPDLCLEYCEEKHIRPKAHCLNYETWTPLWVPHESKQDVPRIKELLEKRMRELAERYKDRIHGWEVTNELLCGIYCVPSQNRSCTPFYKEPNTMEWSFETARRYFPNNELIINEAMGIWEGFRYNRSPYYMQIERGLQNGAPIDAIGMQCHMFTRREEEQKYLKDRYNPQFVCEVLDQYNDFGLPMQITEVTIPAYSFDEEDEAVQAELAEYMYSLWFSSKHMESIIYWNAIDGFAAFAPQGDMTAGENYYHGGLLRPDFSTKPIWKKLYELIHKTWHTSAHVQTNEFGTAQVHAFYGDYRVTVTANGRTTEHTVHHVPNGQPVRIVL